MSGAHLNKTVTRNKLAEKAAALREEFGDFQVFLTDLIESDIKKAIPDGRLPNDEYLRQYAMCSHLLEDWSMFMTQSRFTRAEVSDKIDHDLNIKQTNVEDGTVNSFTEQAILRGDEDSATESSKTLVNTVQKDASTSNMRAPLLVNKSKAISTVLTASESASKFQYDEAHFEEPENFFLKNAPVVPPPDVSQLKRRFDAFVSHLNSPFDFYIQISHDDVAKRSELVDFQETLNTYYENNRDPVYFTPRMLEALVGTFCVAIFPNDKRWYRARVKKVDVRDPKHRFVTVEYIDYGNSSKINPKYLLPLIPDAAELPAQAYRCRIKDIELTSADGEALIYFENATSDLLQTVMLAKLPVTVDWDTVLEVNLKITNEPCETLTLRELLIERGLAEPIGSVFPLEVVEEQFGSDVVANSNQNAETKPVTECPRDDCSFDDDEEDPFDKFADNNPVTAFLGFETKEEDKVCKFFHTPRGCFQGDHCSYKHTKNPLPLVNCVDEQIYYTREPDVLQIGKFYVVRITSVSGRDLYAMFSSDARPLSSSEVADFYQGLLTAKSQKISHDYMKLRGAMREHYSKIAKKNYLAFPAQGSLVAVKQMSEFCRCRVLENYNEEKSCLVECIDTGSKFVANRKDIATLQTQFTELPSLARQLYLSPKMQSEELTMKCDNVLWKYFVAEVTDLSPDGVFEVVLTSLEDESLRRPSITGKA